MTRPANWDAAQSTISWRKYFQDCCITCCRSTPVRGLHITVLNPLGQGVGPARVRLEDPAGAVAAVERMTNDTGEILFFPIAAQQWRVKVYTDFHLPALTQITPDMSAVDNAIATVAVQVEELAYELLADYDRNGRLDNTDLDNPPRGIIRPWTWDDGEGPIVLYNADRDGPPPAAPAPAPAAVMPAAAAPAAPAAPAPLAPIVGAHTAPAAAIAAAALESDATDAVVNAGDDGTHELTPLRIRRRGSALVPDAAAAWKLVLSIKRAPAGKVRIFENAAAGSQCVLGAGAVGAAAVPSKDYAVVLPGPMAATLADVNLWMEATSYPHGAIGGANPEPAFDGLVDVELKVEMASCVNPGHTASYTTGAQFRVAPWLMPHNGDAVSDVYVSNLGADTNWVIRTVFDFDVPTGNTKFRTALRGFVTASAPGTRLVEQVTGDKWTRDCMSVGYSVAPSPGAAARHRIDVALRAYRIKLFDLGWYPRSLMAANVGFTFPAASLLAQKFIAAYTDAPAPAAAVGPLRLAVRAAVTAKFGANVANPANTNAANAAGDAVRLEMQTRGTLDAALPHLEAVAMRAIQLHVPPPAAAAVQPYVVAAAKAAAEAAALIVCNAAGSTAYDAGGNIDCTLPCKTADRTYPMGRIYYGTPAQFDATTRGFLAAQIVQRPFTIDTTWLKVGHVDEVVAFIPAPRLSPDDPLGAWAVLVPSPKQAYTILDRMPADARMFEGRRHDRCARVRDLRQVTVADMRKASALVPIPWGNSAAMSGRQLWDYNDVIETKIEEKVVAVLTDEIGLTKEQIIRVPVLFMPEGGTNASAASALTPNMVNMIVVNTTCIMSKPFGPQYPAARENAGELERVLAGKDAFEEDVKRQIARVNDDVFVRFIDDWDLYHMHSGDIHCGTNAIRRPAAADLNAWLQSPKSAWWTYAGP